VKPTSRRLLVAIVAWPAGLIAAVLLLFVPTPGDAACPPGEACALHLIPTWKVLLWLCLACAPGVLATARWWKARHSSI
jgi:hypothetical protein